MSSRARGLWAVLTSVRTSIAVVLFMLVLLVLSVVMPQRSGVSAAAHTALVERGRLFRILLVDLELGHVPTSRIFIAGMGAFLLNLTAVLGDRTGAALKRCRFSPPTVSQLEVLLQRADTLVVQSSSAAVERAGSLLAALGYRTAAVPCGVWGVKNRFSPLGYPLFHASFFVLWVGGSLLYYTRNVGILSAIEGQWVDTASAHAVTRAPIGAPQGMKLSVQRIDVGIDRGRPTELTARIELEGGEVREVRVNAPLVVGPATVLLERAGIAPVLRLEDARAVTRERVAVAARAEDGRSVRAPLGDTGLEIEVEPIEVGPAFPLREALPTTVVGMRVRAGDAEVLSGRLRPGEAAPLGSGRLVVEEVRYWVALRVVHERGGALLVAGFLLGVVGILLRMVCYRREIAVVANGTTLRIAGRAEFFQDRSREELAALHAEIEAGERAGIP